MLKTVKTEKTLYSGNVFKILNQKNKTINCLVDVMTKALQNSSVHIFVDGENEKYLKEFLFNCQYNGSVITEFIYQENKDFLYDYEEIVVFILTEYLQPIVENKSLFSKSKELVKNT